MNEQIFDIDGIKTMMLTDRQTDRAANPRGESRDKQKSIKAGG
jgi:hypothetical protein